MKYKYTRIILIFGMTFCKYPEQFTDLCNQSSASLYELFWKMTHPYTIEGTLGTTLTISGSGFGAKTGKVLIEGMKTKIAKNRWTDTMITATVTKVPATGVAMM